MPDPISNGTRREIAGRPCVYFDGYWIKWYPPPKDSLEAKKQLIEALTRRLFNHVEHGINMPGYRLHEARHAYDTETEQERKRVKGAMLAGALFNRAADIFRKLVELQELGVEIDADDSLMRQCGQCLLEALEFGKNVRHRSGDESIDELWGEPFKAFSVPIEDFYESRYLKIAQTMHDIDQIADKMIDAFTGSMLFPGIHKLIRDFAEAAKLKCETLRTDPVIFEVWPTFVTAGDQLSHIRSRLPLTTGDGDKREAEDGIRLIEQGKKLLTYIARARVSMPKSMQSFIAQCDHYSQTYPKGIQDQAEPTDRKAD
jgi:hypothetical protein